MNDSYSSFVISLCSDTEGSELSSDINKSYIFKILNIKEKNISKKQMKNYYIKLTQFCDEKEDSDSLEHNENSNNQFYYKEMLEDTDNFGIDDFGTSDFSKDDLDEEIFGNKMKISP